MSTFKLLQAEIFHRKTNFALSVLALVAAATLFVAGPTLLRGYAHESNKRLDAMQKETDTALAAMQDETAAELAAMQEKAKVDLDELDKRTKRIMRELGFNLRIVHKNTDMSKLYANFMAFDMPEEYVERLASSPQITKIAHIVATLKQMITWEDQPRLLVGFAPESVQAHVEKKPPMGFQIKQGTVYLGSVAGEGHKVGDTVEILGKQFQVALILPPHGTAEEDIAIAMHLKDAQEVLDKPGKISEIVALGCKCSTVNRVEEITEQLELVLPEAKVTEQRLSAIAREDQRKLVEEHNRQTMAEYAAKREAIIAQETANRRSIIEQEQSHQQNIIGLLNGVTSFAVPLIVLICAVWIGLLAWSNVRERRAEIGLLRAIGKGSANIVSLLLGKAVLLGFVGGTAGCVLGYGLAYWLAVGILKVPAEQFTPAYDVLVYTVLGAPLVAAIASYLPTLSAVTQDPAVVLMEG
jgi:putative ABC transport system permease protein